MRIILKNSFIVKTANIRDFTFGKDYCVLALTVSKQAIVEDDCQVQTLIPKESYDIYT